LWVSFNLTDRKVINPTHGKEITMAETKTVKTVLGDLEFDEKNNHYSMTSNQLYGQLEEAGLANPKEVIEALQKAQNTVLQKFAHFTSDGAKKTMKDTSLSAGKMPYRLEASTVIEKEVNVPGHDGAPTERKTLYGVTSAKVASKTPSFIKKDDYLHQNSDEIEKELTKNRSHIKIAS
jgi:hypothetical protein